MLTGCDLKHPILTNEEMAALKRHGPSRLADAQHRHHLRPGDAPRPEPRWIASAPRPNRPSTTATAWSCCPTAIGRAAFRSARCWPAAPVHHHLVSQAKRTRIGICWRPARPAKCITTACWSVTAPTASIPISPSRRCGRRVGRAGRQRRVRHDDAHRRGLSQGRGQGHAQGHGQDGYLDAAVLQGRADLRGTRPGQPGHRPLLCRHPESRAGRRFRRARRRGAAPACPRFRRPANRSCRRCPTRASSTGAAPASGTPGSRSHCIAAGRRAGRQQGRLPSSSPRSHERRRAHELHAARPAEISPSAQARFRWTKSSRPARSSSASAPAR